MCIGATSYLCLLDNSFVICWPNIRNFPWGSKNLVLTFEDLLILLNLILFGSFGDSFALDCRDSLVGSIDVLGFATCSLFHLIIFVFNICFLGFIIAVSFYWLRVFILSILCQLVTTNYIFEVISHVFAGCLVVGSSRLVIGVLHLFVTFD